MAARRRGTTDEERLAEAIGVTRVARVTGLDRTGIEVACAVRPRGHVLQVSNGKGIDFATARLSALLEAAELWAAEQVDPADLLWGDLLDLRARFGEGSVWDARDLGSAGDLVAPELWTARTRCAWREGQELLSGEPVLVPARALHCLPAGSTPLGPAVIAWTSNGSGASAEPAAALEHALLEAIERDQLARALPEGWIVDEVGTRLIARDGLERLAPRTAEVAARIEPRGFAVHLFELTPEGEGCVALPVAGALLVDRHWGPVPLTAGYACRRTWDEALLSALLEAAQSRLTDIHGAREDVEHADPAPLAQLAAACERAKAARSATALARAHRAPRPGVRGLLRRIAAAGFTRAAAVDLTPPGSPVSIARVVVPGLRVSELLA